MDNEENIIYCSRCGSKMSAKSRYCMKCGNLNEEHPDNNKYSGIIEKTKKENRFQLGSGKRFFLRNVNKSGVNLVTNKNTYNVRMGFIIFNVVVLAIACLIALLPLFTLNPFTLNNILESGVCLNLFYVGVFSLFFIGFQILFIKLNEHWWLSLIPFYNYYILSDVLFNKGWLFVLVFIPVVNIGYLLVLFYKIGEAFKKNGILSAILGPIMIVIIAFGSSAFNNIYYVVDDSPEALEKTYGSYSRFAKFSLFILVVGLVGYLFSSNALISLRGGKDELSIIGGAELSINKVNKAIKRDKVTCVDESGNEVSIYQDGVYYFYSEDFLYDYGFRSNLIDGSRGYVKVESNMGNFDFYVAYSADNLGIPETRKEDLDVDLVERDITIDEPIGIMCTID